MSAIPFDGNIHDGFEAVPTFKSGASIPHGSPHGPLGANGILAFRHKKSQVRIVMFAAPGPIVSGTIIVGTRPISNAGHPHTLEHIVFLGSHKYPVRGYLDNLACRCIADGTNAWTDNDHTAYTCTTAGFDGFAELLPCFLDHVLRPKINDASFASEVYHIRSDGKEAGVVFCEMQAREHTEADITDRELRGLLLSGTPLSLESGGLCEDIRHLSNEEIVRFHQDQYCGANVTIVVGGGQIVPNELLGCIKAELDDVSSCAGFDPGEPQWRVPLNLQPLPPRTRKVVPFPCADTELGTIVFGWRGAGAVHRLTNMGIGVLLHYFTHDVWSPMRQRFVETENRVASDISFSQEVFRDASVIEISFEGIKHLGRDDDDSEDEDGEEDEDDEEEEEEEEGNEMSVEEDAQASVLTSGKVEEMFMGFLRDVLRCGKLPGGLECIHAAIKNERESYLAALESECHGIVASYLVEEVVYGAGTGLTIGEEVRGALDMYDTLAHKNEEFWLDLLDSVFVQAARVELIMVPDCTLAHKLSNEEKTALKNRIEQFGKHGLEAVGKANEDRVASLKAASFDSARFPPVPSTANISRRPYSVSQTETDFYVTQSVKLESDIVRCTIFLDTSDLPLSTRVFLPLVCELLLQSDIVMSDGSLMAYTENARALDKVTISTSNSGVGVGFANGLADNCVIIHYAATPNCFEAATKLILLNLFHTRVSAERVGVVSQSLLANSTADMRDGSEALSSAAMLLPYAHETMALDTMNTASETFDCTPNFVFNHSIANQCVYSRLCEQFAQTEASDDAQTATLRKIQDVFGCLRRRAVAQVFVQLTARDTQRAQTVVAREWAHQHQQQQQQQQRANKAHAHVHAYATAISRRRYASLNERLNGRMVGVIIGIGGVESTNMQVRVDSHVPHGHADWGALTVLLEMLARTEGTLSDAVRANGLAYGASVRHNSWLAHLTLSIDESSSPVAAWHAVCAALLAFRRALHDHTQRATMRTELATAKASALFALNCARATPDAIMRAAAASAARGEAASALADRRVEQRVENVKLQQLASVFDAHVARLLRDEGRLVVVTCGRGESEELRRAFARCEHALTLSACCTELLQRRFAARALAQWVNAG